MATVNLDRVAKAWTGFTKIAGVSGVHTAEDYERALALVDQIMDRTRNRDERENPGSPLNQVLTYLSPMIEDYEERRYPMPSIGPIDYIKRLMAENGLTQSDLPEIGNQSVVSQTLSGKRDLNVRQIRALSERFGVPTSAFI